MATTYDGTISSFTTTPGQNLDIGGAPYNVQDAGRSYSLEEVDNQTLRFEIHAGDPAWFDGSTIDRSEVQMDNLIPVGTPTNISYQFMLEPGATNTAQWLVTAEMHSNDGDLGSNVHTSPPFAIELQGEHLQVVARYGDPTTGSITTMTLWTDPNPIVRGQYYNIQIQTNVANNSSGLLNVFINGNQVVNYNGALGYGSRTYWEEGLYRHTAPEAIAADFRNLTITTGSLSGPTTPTQPTTPTTPPNVAPSVTQASASPGTGTEHVGDTVTMTLGFSEAVTVTGTPTLKLNDGGTATYVGGSGTSALTFKTTVASTDTNTSALAITGVNLPSGTSIKDAGGLAANLSGAVTTFSGLQISTSSTTPTTPTTPTQPTAPTTPPNVAPTVTQAAASPGTGIEHVGDTVTMTLGFSEAVTVTGTPTLKLNDGGTATYVGGSGTSSLTFKTTVASTNTNTSALAITGVNLPSGTSIKDAGGLAANLSGAVKTFSGLQISTSTTPSTPTTPTTPSVTKPVLTIADNSLSVAARGGKVALGANVTTTDPNDLVTVNIQGLPKYETITDNLDGRTFSGSNITLTSAQVDSGLTLHSYYRGGGHPVATLTLTANAKDPVTGAVTSAAPQTITVTDPRPAATTTTSSQTNHHHATATSASTVAATAPQPTTATGQLPAVAPSAGALANDGFALLQQHTGAGTSTLATTTAPQAITSADHGPGTATASLASQSFALLNQYLAGNSGRVDPGQIVAAVSQGPGWSQQAFLTRPQH